MNRRTWGQRNIIHYCINKAQCRINKNNCVKLNNDININNYNTIHYKYCNIDIWKNKRKLIKAEWYSVFRNFPSNWWPKHILKSHNMLQIKLGMSWNLKLNVLNPEFHDSDILNKTTSNMAQQLKLLFVERRIYSHHQRFGFPVLLWINDSLNKQHFKSCAHVWCGFGQLKICVVSH